LAPKIFDVCFEEKAFSPTETPATAAVLFVINSRRVFLSIGLAFFIYADQFRKRKGKNSIIYHSKRNKISNKKILLI
jgi:hypothetical protein